LGPITLALSPHLDDAVLSCPVHLQRLRAQGQAVVVATIFTEGDQSAEAQYRQRRAEDRRAVRALGCSRFHFGFLDAPFRSDAYRDFCGIAFGEVDPTTQAAVADRIGRLAARLKPERVFAPLAVGNHVDHRLVRQAALRAVSHDRLLFYEDRPYAFVPSQVEHVTERPGPLDPRYFDATYACHYLGNTSREAVEAKWAAMDPIPLHLERFESLRASPEELRRLRDAICSYPSQVLDLFRDEAELLGLYGQSLETIWKLT
jgi:LmbE family N-acetylglucosaminyl deacetylase